MNSTVAQAIVSGASGVVGALVGGGLQIVHAQRERKDRRTAEREAIQRGIAGQTLGSVGKLVDATTALQALQETMDKARQAGNLEALRHAVEETESVNREHSATLFAQVALGFQIADDDTRKAAIRIAEDISDLLDASHTPLTEEDTTRERRVDRVAELESSIRVQYRELCKLLGAMTRL